MNAAAIGLVGVVVGAMLAGVINLVLDRRSRLAKARAAGQLIGVELTMAQAKIASAIDASRTSSGATNGSPAPAPAGAPPEGMAPASAPDGSQRTATAQQQPPPVDPDGWWTGDLLTDAWKQHQSDLAIDVRPQVLEAVARAYAICALLNAEHVEARKTQAGPRADLGDYARTVGAARDLLVDESKIRNRKAFQRAARWSPAWVVTTLALVLAILALIAPRVDVNSASVTSAVQSGLGRSMLVQCDPGLGDWECTAYPASWSTASCPATTAVFEPHGIENASAARVPAPSTCSSTSQPVTFTADVEGGKVVAAVAEGAGHVDAVREIVASLGTSNALQRAWRSIFG